MGFLRDFIRNPITAISPISGAVDTVTGSRVGGQIGGAIGGIIKPPGLPQPGIPNQIIQPNQRNVRNLRVPLPRDPSGSNTALAVRNTQGIGRAPQPGRVPEFIGGPLSAPGIRNAPGVDSVGSAPRATEQSQQTFSGQDINRLLQKSNQFEATTGREVTGALTEGLSRAAFGEAADRSAQNKSLALQEQQVELQRFGLDSSQNINLTGLELDKFRAQSSADLQKFGAETSAALGRSELQLNQFRTQVSADFQRFGLDADTQFKKAGLILQAQGADRQFALAQFTSELQATGLRADQAFRLAQQSIDVQIQNETNRIQREGIASGLAINQANARAQGIGTLLNLGVTAATFVAASERDLKNNIVPFKVDENELNLEEVKKLPLYHFKYIGHEDHMMGAMTDEMPESIKTDEGRKVNLYSLNTMLLSAVKSLIGRVEELEAQNGIS